MKQINIKKPTQNKMGQKKATNRKPSDSHLKLCLLGRLRQEDYKSKAGKYSEILLQNKI